MNNSATTRRITVIALQYNENDKGQAEYAYSQNLLGRTAEQKFLEMKIVAERHPNIKNIKWALTGYISPHIEANKKLSKEDLTKLTLKALQKIGVTEKNQLAMDIHHSTKQKHIHWVVNRISLEGRCTVRAANIGKRFGEAVREVCKEMGIKTDVEIGKEKKSQMLQDLQKSIVAVSDFEQLKQIMDRKGYRLSLNENIKDGISGIRIVMKEDINNETLKVYEPGYKLSEITRKLTVAEIKEIFAIKNFIFSQRTEFGNLYKLQMEAEKQNLEIKLKFNDKGDQIEKIFIRPQEISKPGLFHDLENGYDLGKIDHHFDTMMKNEINLSVDTNKFSFKSTENSDINILQPLRDIAKILLKPAYVAGGEESEYKRRRKSKLFKR